MAADQTVLDAIEMIGLLGCCGSLQAALDRHHEGCQRKWYFAEHEKMGCKPCKVLYNADLETAHRSAALYWGTALTNHAAKKGDLAALRYLHSSGCPWDDKTCESAAKTGSLECLRYAHEHGCPWHTWTIPAAAFNGNVDCLVYAHKQGCGYDAKRTLEGTIFGMSLSCLVYAHRFMGCVWSGDGNEAVQAYCSGNLEALGYICSRSNALPLPSVLNKFPLCGVYSAGAYWDTFLSKSVSEKWCRDRALCLLFLHAHTKAVNAKAWIGPVGRTALKIMAAMRAAVNEAFALARLARSDDKSVDAAHCAMARMPLDIIEKILRAARLYRYTNT